LIFHSSSIFFRRPEGAKRRNRATHNKADGDRAEPRALELLDEYAPRDERGFFVIDNTCPKEKKKVHAAIVSAVVKIIRTMPACQRGEDNLRALIKAHLSDSNGHWRRILAWDARDKYVAGESD